MEKKCFAFGCYTVSIILFLFYLFVLRNGLKPEVSQEYSMFYIEHKLAYYLKDGELQNYGVNEKFTYVPDGKYRNQGMGWSAMTETGIWTQGRKSFLYFYINEKKESGYDLRLYTCESIGKELQIYANGNRIAEREIRDDGIFEMYLPAGFVSEGINEIRIEMKNMEDAQSGILVNAAELAEIM